MGSFTGSVVSATGLTMVQFAMAKLVEYRQLAYALLLIVMMIFKPTGLLGVKEFSMSALLARVSQLRAQNPYVPTRLYTQLAVEDARSMEFYLGNGFQLDDAEDLVRFPVPEGGDLIPMGCTVANVPLRNEFEQQAMLNRMNQSRIAPLDLNALGQCMQRPHFLALAVLRNDEPMGEVLLSGTGDRATLAALYIRPAYRRTGLGKALLARALHMLRDEGVTQVEALVLRRSAAQCALARSFGARFINTTCFYPGIDMG